MCWWWPNRALRPTFYWPISRPATISSPTGSAGRRWNAGTDGPCASSFPICTSGNRSNGCEGYGFSTTMNRDSGNATATTCTATRGRKNGSGGTERAMTASPPKYEIGSADLLANRSEDRLPEVLQLFDRFANVGQGTVAAGLHRRVLQHFRIPPACQLLDRRNVDVAIVEPGLELRHVPA